MPVVGPGHRWSSKRNCRIAQRIARTPKRALGAHIRSSCSRNVTVWQVCSRHIHRRIVPPDPHRDPGPRARLSPPPPRARGLVRSPHNPGSQRGDHRTLCRASEHLGCEPRSSDGCHPNRRADHTDHNDQATQSSSRLGETPPEVLESSRGRSPLIIKDLDLYPQPPTNTRSPALNSEEPVCLRAHSKV